MNNKLINIANNIKGTIITIGFEQDSPLIKALDRNKQVTELMQLTDKSASHPKQKKITNSGVTINIKKLKRYFGEYKFDYLICDYRTIKLYLRSFVKNSIALTNKEIIMDINEENVDIENLKKRFSRHNVKCSCLINILKLDCRQAKISLIKRPLYFISDIGYALTEILAKILTN